MDVYLRNMREFSHVYHIRNEPLNAVKWMIFKNADLREPNSAL